MSDTSTKANLSRRYGPCAVVTGASSGIGEAFARQLASKGFDLVLVARRADLLEALAAALSERHGVKCDAVPLDFVDAGSGAALDAATASRDVGLFVASAGFGTSGTFLENDLSDELRMIDVNCRAAAEQTHRFGKRFVERGRGGIILMSSLVAFQGVPRAANYAATKAYIQVLAEGLRAELGSRGVDVLSVAPGPVDTEFNAVAGMKPSMSQGPEIVARDALSALGRSMTVRPGWLAKLLEGALAPLPRRGRTLIMTQVMAGMTKAGTKRQA